MPDVTVLRHGDWIALSDADGARLSFTAAEAEAVAFQLLGCAAGARAGQIEATLTALRRDHQQIVTALQEVAAKVARLDQLSRVRVAHLNPLDLQPGTLFMSELADGSNAAVGTYLGGEFIPVTETRKTNV